MSEPLVAIMDSLHVGSVRYCKDVQKEACQGIVRHDDDERKPTPSGQSMSVSTDVIPPHCFHRRQRLAQVTVLSPYCRCQGVDTVIRSTDIRHILGGPAMLQPPVPGAGSRAAAY